jgi:hypothetical protein
MSRSRSLFVSVLVSLSAIAATACTEVGAPATADGGVGVPFSLNPFDAPVPPDAAVGGPRVTISAPTGTLTTATPTAIFSAAGAVTAQCRFTQTAGVGALTACASTYTAGALRDGAWFFEVIATDGAGRTGSASAPFTIATTAPQVTISGPPAVVSTPTATGVFTVAGTATINQCRFTKTPGTGAWAPCASPCGSPVLADGAWYFEVEATNAAGLRGNASRSFTVDTGGALVVSTAALTVREGTSASVDVTLSRPPVGTVTVAVTKTSSAFTVPPALLSFTSSTWNIAQRIIVTAPPDADALHAIAQPLTLTASTGHSATIAVTVEDDDLLVVTPVSYGQVCQGTSIDLDVWLAGPPLGPTQVITFSKGAGVGDVGLSTYALTLTASDGSHAHVVHLRGGKVGHRTLYATSPNQTTVVINGEVLAWNDPACL